jgi:hypothetical protein
MRYAAYRHFKMDIRDRQAIRDLFETERPGFIIHTAAQPSHDKAASIPYDDFDVNADGTVTVTGFEVAEIDLFLQRPNNKRDQKDCIGRSESGPAISKSGDIWLLGEHRLVCGSSLDCRSYQAVDDPAMAEIYGRSRDPRG